MEFVSDSKPMPSDNEMRIEKIELLEKRNVELNCKQDIEESVLQKKNEANVDECESQKMVAGKQTVTTTLDLQIELDKHNKDSGPSNGRRQQIQSQQQLQPQLQHPSRAIRNEPKIEKNAQAASSLSLPMTTIAGWPGGLPPMGSGMGQVRPHQGMTSLDGTPGSSNSVQPPQFPLSQPRPKRCATHYYVARNIYYHQQFQKMNPFWPAAAGSASLYGNKPYNLNVLPPTETAIIGNPLLGSFPGRNLNPLQDKAQVEGTKDKSSVAANFIDSAQRNQMLLQQPAQQAAL
ncbi:Time for coffee-like, partial [Thalictrum thalictroides]